MTLAFTFVEVKEELLNKTEQQSSYRVSSVSMIVGLKVLKVINGFRSVADISVQLSPPFHFIPFHLNKPALTDMVGHLQFLIVKCLSFVAVCRLRKQSCSCQCTNIHLIVCVHASAWLQSIFFAIK